MADLEPPSFSLGLDFDLDSEARPDPDPFNAQPQRSSSAVQQDEDDDFESPSGLDHDSSALDPPRALKRLRRGPTLPAQKGVAREDCSNLDDDIEDFSSQEDNPLDDRDPAMRCHSLLSSSKLPLNGLGVVTSQSASQWKTRKKEELSNSLGSANIGSSNESLMFPRITMSPLRRFQLIDSDSDDFSFDEAAKKDVNHLISPGNDEHTNPNRKVTLAETKTRQLPTKKSKQEDLWKDFCSEKSFHIPTPALDEVCEEYFRSVKDKNEARNNHRGCIQTNSIGNKSVQQCNLDPLPPAHCYLFHDDLRIQKLVRDRLPHFAPLGTTISQGYQQHDAPVIDYISQFNHGEGSKGATKRQKAELNSTRGRKNTKSTNKKKTSQESENWIDPKSCAGITKDAGKRRVHAVGKSAGHWYTDTAGRKVYVTKNGQELTGQLAYRHYRKESGARFKKPKKKTTSKRKTAAKK